MYMRSLVPRPRSKSGRGLGRLWANRLCTQYAVRRGELWSACDHSYIVLCVHPGWEGLFVDLYILDFVWRAIICYSEDTAHKQIRKSTWNPEIHFEFEIQKSTWNPEIQSEIRNPREIQWISKSRTPRRAVADPSLHSAATIIPKLTTEPMQVFKEDVQSCNVYMSLQSMGFPAYVEGCTAWPNLALNHD